MLRILNAVVVSVDCVVSLNIKHVVSLNISLWLGRLGNDSEYHKVCYFFGERFVHNYFATFVVFVV